MIIVSEGQLEEIKQHLEQGLFLRAYQVSRQIGPLTEWNGCDAYVCAGRLAFYLGAPRLSRVLFRRAYTQHPDSLRAYVYELGRVQESYGPVAALRFLDTTPAPQNGEPADTLALLLSKSLLFGKFRDFSSADRFLKAAERIDPTDRYVLLQRCILHELEDSYDEGLRLCEVLVRKHPDFAAGAGYFAHLLLLSNRFSQALAFLSDIAGNLECFALCIQIVTILRELENYEECSQYLQEISRLAPLKEKSLDMWLRATDFQVQYRSGHFNRAVQLAGTLPDKEKPEYLRRLSAKTPVKRVRLSVPFVRQNHDTCAPATLSALTQYWGRSIPHLQIVESICYDGTPSYKIRGWAAENEWFIREFTLTWQGACKLINLQIPFGVTIIEPTGGHLHAVIGYDGIRETLLIRDPSIYHTIEVEADKYLQRYAGSGPTALVLVPAEKKDLLERIELPDAAMYDLLFGIQESLSRYDHQKALRLLKQLEIAHHYNHVTSIGLLSLAAYDHSTTSLLKALVRHLEVYPQDHTALFRLIACYNEIGLVAAKRARLKELCRKDIHPIFFREYARDLITSDLDRNESLYWLKRSVRAQHKDAESVKLYGDFLWSVREFDQAHLFYRLAVTLEDKNETYIPHYLAASRYLKKAEEVVELLKKRISLYGTRSTRPLISLLDAYRNMDQVDTAFRLLESELKEKPGDGELLTYAAEMWAAYGRFAEAQSCLEVSKGKIERVRRHRTVAVIAHYRGDKKGSFKSWQTILKLDPLNMEAHTFVSSLLCEMKGTPTALGHLSTACERFPHHVELNRLWITLLADQDLEQMEAVALRLLAVHPNETWVHRKLSVAMCQREQYVDAEQYLIQASRIEPDSPVNQTAFGMLYTAWGKPDKARQAFEKSLTFAADTPETIVGLFALGTSIDEKKAAVEFVEKQLTEHTINGEGLIPFYNIARTIVDPDALLEKLQSVNRRRPDLWQTWSVLTSHCIAVGRVEDAETCAVQASERFPLLPPVWMDLARVHNLRGSTEKEKQAVTTAHKINPSWPVSSQRLCALYMLDGELDKAEVLIKNACAHSPLDAVNHGIYADVLRHQNRNKEAYRELKQALYLDASYEWAWNALQSLCYKEGLPERPTELIRELWREKTNETLLEVRLAEGMFFSNNVDGAVETLRAIMKKDPHFIPAYDLLARIHVWMGDYEKAFKFCAPETFEPIPFRLQVRRAWIFVQKKDYETAARNLRTIVEHNPESYECWQLLLESLGNLGLYEELEEISKKLSVLFPFEPDPLSRLGDVYLKTEKPEQARQVFEKAFHLNRGYFHAGTMLFDLELQRGEIERADRILSLLKQQFGDSYAEIVARTAQLAVKNNDSTTSGSLFRTLCLVDLDDPWPLDSTIAVMEQAGWHDRLWVWISDVIGDARINPKVARIWAERGAHRNLNIVMSKLRKIDVLTRNGADIVTTLVDGLYTALVAAIQKKEEHSFFELKHALRTLFRRYYMTILMYPGAWARIMQAILFCGYVEKAYAKVNDGSRFTSVTTEMISAVVSTYYLHGNTKKAWSALDDLEYRAANVDMSKEKHDMIQSMVQMFKRLLSRSYKQAPDETLPMDGLNYPLEFIQYCSRYIAALHAEHQGRRNHGSEVADRFLHDYPQVWYMGAVFGFLSKQYKKKRYA